MRYSLADATDLGNFDNNSNLLNMNTGMNFNTPHEPLPTNPPGHNENNSNMTQPPQYNPNIEVNSLESVENAMGMNLEMEPRKEEEMPFQQMNRDVEMKDKMPVTTRGLADNNIIRERKQPKKETFVPIQYEQEPEPEFVEKVKEAQNQFNFETKSIYIALIAFAVIIACMYIYKKSFRN